MKILLLGASGDAGSRLAAEARSRGHWMVSRGRRPFAPALPALPASLTLVLDASDPGQVARAAGTHDLVIAATRPAVDTQGRSALLMEDFAIAVLDEAERPTVRRGLLSIGR